MFNKKLIQQGLIDTLGVTIYVALVALVMKNGEKIFGKMDNILGPIAFLLLFVLSTAITGSLVLLKPILLYLEKDKKGAVELFSITLLWLFAITLIALSAQLLF